MFSPQADSRRSFLKALAAAPVGFVVLALVMAPDPRRWPPPLGAAVALSCLVTVFGSVLVCVAWRSRLRVYSRGTWRRWLSRAEWLAHADAEMVLFSTARSRFPPDPACVPWRLPSLLDRRRSGLDWSVTGVMPIGFRRVSR